MHVFPPACHPEAQPKDLKLRNLYRARRLRSLAPLGMTREGRGCLLGWLIPAPRTIPVLSVGAIHESPGVNGPDR